MVLAKPVLKENGMVLIAQGTELTENHFSILKKTGYKIYCGQGNSPGPWRRGLWIFNKKKTR